MYICLPADIRITSAKVLGHRAGLPLGNSNDYKQTYKHKKVGWLLYAALETHIVKPII